MPRIAITLVMAAVRVVLPWSTWPIVPTLTWGLVRSNFCFANVYFLLLDWPGAYVRQVLLKDSFCIWIQDLSGAHERIRTVDRGLTKIVLYLAELRGRAIFQAP